MINTFLKIMFQLYLDLLYLALKIEHDKYPFEYCQSLKVSVTSRYNFTSLLNFSLIWYYWVCFDYLSVNSIQIMMDADHLLSRTWLTQSTGGLGYASACGGMGRSPPGCSPHSALPHQSSPVNPFTHQLQGQVRTHIID